MTTYYFSSSGNNSNSGTSSGSPLLNFYANVFNHSGSYYYLASSGDQFLFNKGDVWPGGGWPIAFTIQTTASGTLNFTMGTYGTGAAPVVNGMSAVYFVTTYAGASVNGWTVSGINFAGSGVILEGSVGVTSSSISISSNSNLYVSWLNGGFSSVSIGSNTALNLGWGDPSQNGAGAANVSGSATSNTLTALSVSGAPPSTFTGNSWTGSTVNIFLWYLTGALSVPSGAITASALNIQHCSAVATFPSAVTVPAGSAFTDSNNSAAPVFSGGLTLNGTVNIQGNSVAQSISWSGTAGNVAVTGNTASTTLTSSNMATLWTAGNSAGATFTSCVVSGGVGVSGSNGGTTQVNKCTITGGLIVSSTGGTILIDQNSVSGALSPYMSNLLGGSIANSYYQPGAGGIWVVATAGGTITIQRNAVYNITGGEGSGILVDCATSASNTVTVQYNLVYQCAGAGIHISASPYSGFTTTLVCRYNLTWHNCQQTPAGWRYGELQISHGVNAATIFNNTHIAADYGTATPPAVLLRGKSASGVTIRNCILQSGSGPQVACYESNLSTSQVLFQGNGYWSAAGTLNVLWFGTTYTSLGTWQGTSQEKNGGSSYGNVGDPTLVNPTAVPAVTAPWSSLTAANGLAPQGSSPDWSNGLNLNSLFGTSVGTQDYFGTTLSGSVWSVGGVYQ